MLRLVGRYENPFIFILEGNKLQDRHKITGSVGLVETQVFLSPHAENSRLTYSH